MKIASLSPAVTEILYCLELQDQIVCTDQFSDFPEDAETIPHLKDHTDIDVRDILDYEPDIIFTSTVIQEQLANQLTNTHFSVVHQDPRTLNEIYESIRAIGLMFEVERQAEQLILTLIQGFNDVKKKANIMNMGKEQPKIYIEEWGNPPMVSGNWVPEVTKFAGGKQFPIAVGELSREVFLSEVADWDPDFIVISWCGAGLMVDPEALTSRPGWENVCAVQEGNVRVIDDSLLNRPGPRLVEGCQRLYGWLFELLH